MTPEERPIDRRPASASPSGSHRFLILAIVLLVPIVLASLHRITRHALPLHWDEAMHIDTAIQDTTALKHGFLEYAQRVMTKKRTLPPAYRILHLPVTLASGVTPRSLRLVALASLFATLLFVYKAVALAAGREAGAFSAVFTMLLPVVVSPLSQFGTEYTLFLAVAGCFWCIARVLYLPDAKRPGIVPLGLLVGLGLLSKTTFLVLMTPALLVLVAAWRRQLLPAESMRRIARGVALGACLAFPWWVYNWMAALWGAYSASHFIRHALPYHSWFLKAPAYVGLILECGFGYPLAALALAIVVLALRRRDLSARLIRDPRHLVMLAACVVPAVLFCGVQFTGVGQNARHAAPALIAVAVALGVAIGVMGFAGSARFFAGAAAAFIVQAGLMLTAWPYDHLFGDRIGYIGEQPSAVFHPYDQWDWAPLRALCQERLKNPSKMQIGHLGSGFAFSEPQITYPWVLNGEQVEVDMLWSYEQGPLDWDKLLARLNGFDVVVTAPRFVGWAPDKQPLDNQYNAELVERLRSDDRFTLVSVLHMGDAGEEVDVFMLNRSLK